jgi:hypothetical protein
MIGPDPMRETQELAKREWERQEADRKKRKEFRRRLLTMNRARKHPYQICRACKQPIHPSERHWLFKRHCDSHGVNRLEKLVESIVEAKGRKATIRLLKRLAK